MVVTSLNYFTSLNHKPIVQYKMDKNWLPTSTNFRFQSHKIWKEEDLTWEGVDLDLLRQAGRAGHSGHAVWLILDTLSHDLLSESSPYLNTWPHSTLVLQFSSVLVECNNCACIALRDKKWWDVRGREGVCVCVFVCLCVCVCALNFICL